MARRPLSARKRQALLNAHLSACHICKGQIGIGEAWEVEHLIPLAMGGDDDESNMAPAHVKCHRGKSSDDMTNIARAKRLEQRHAGIRAPKRKIPQRPKARREPKITNIGLPVWPREQR